MSNYYVNYNQYLGAQRCCNLKVQGPVGPQGPAGPASIGPPGYTGPPGESFTGPTGRGCRGPTGEPGNPSGLTGYTGATGPSFWDASGNSAIKYNNDVYIGGKLNVDGLIDPTGLILDSRAAIPPGITDPSNILWVKNTVPTTLYYGSNPLLNSFTVTYGSEDSPIRFYLKDENIDNADYSNWEFDANGFASGYFATDLNGDGNVDNADYSIWEKNANDFISVIKP
jgi:hypothetical protein